MTFPLEWKRRPKPWRALRRLWLQLFESKTFSALFGGAIAMVTFEHRGAAVAFGAALLTVAAYCLIFRKER
jgi:hypothetical protein